MSVPVSAERLYLCLLSGCTCVCCGWLSGAVPVSAVGGCRGRRAAADEGQHLLPPEQTAPPQQGQQLAGPPLLAVQHPQLRTAADPVHRL